MNADGSAGAVGSAGARPAGPAETAETRRRSWWPPVAPMAAAGPEREATDDAGAEFLGGVGVESEPEAAVAPSAPAVISGRSEPAADELLLPGQL